MVLSKFYSLGEIMLATKATTFYLGELDQPVITTYQLAVFLFKAYKEGKYKDAVIKTSTRTLNRENYKRKIPIFCKTGIISEHPNFPRGKVFIITGKKGFEKGDIACAVDPFAYVSHLSAMAYHGLTDRIPSTLFLSSPKVEEWKRFALAKMEKDLDGDLENYLLAGLPKLTQFRMSTIGKTRVHFHTSVHLGAFKNVRGRSMRVSTLGRTFLDMVREPVLCGGMRHVIQVYRTHAKTNKVLIIDEANRHANQIEKARLGFLLEDIAKVKDESLNEWAKHVQRGGSRKLDPTQEYEPTYSKRWCISLNVPNMEGG
jgi:predicted transcriptional regulator of viral defense system